MDSDNRWKDKLRLSIDVNVPKELLEAHKQSWDKFFEKYSMETINAEELNLETLEPMLDDNDDFYEARIPMRKAISSVQYWVNTGKPPCLSIVDENYNSPEETSLSEEEISAFHPAAISPFEHNSPHPPQPAIIPSEPTKLSSSIISSDSVNTRDYILSSNLAKKNMSLTIVENGKLNDITVCNNNIEEADVYVDVCGTDELPKILNQDKEINKSMNSQSTIIYDYNNHVLPDSEDTTILRVPTGSLKIEDVIPSLRQIRDSPEIYECDINSDKSMSKELKELFVVKTIVEHSIIENNHRRKLFTNPRSPVEWPQYSSPKRLLSRKSSSLSNNSFLHPAFDFSNPKKQMQTWRKKSFYKKKILTSINEKNETVPAEKLNVGNEEKVKKCSVLLKPLKLENLQKKRKSNCENCYDTAPNELESKKMKISEETNMKAPENVTNAMKKSQPMEENQGKENNKFPKIKHCSVILKPIDRLLFKEETHQLEDKKARIPDKFASQEKKESQGTEKGAIQRNSIRISTQNLANDLKFPKKKNDIETKKLDLKTQQKASSSSSDLKCLSKTSNSSIFQMRRTICFEQSESDESENISTKYSKINKKNSTNIFTFDSDEEFDMSSIFHTSRNIAGVKKINENDKTGNKQLNGNVPEENSFFMELSLYTSEEKENKRKSTLDNQIHGLNSRRRTRLTILPSSSEDEHSREEKISKRGRKGRKNAKKPSPSTPNNNEIKSIVIFDSSSKSNKEEEKKISSSLEQSTKKNNKISKAKFHTSKTEKSTLNISKEIEKSKLNTKVAENCSQAQEESEFDDIFDLLPKRKETNNGEKEEDNLINLKEENSQQMRKETNSKQRKKEENSKKLKFISDNKNGENFRQKLRKNDKNLSRILKFSSSGEEDDLQFSGKRVKIKKQVKNNKNDRTKNLTMKRINNFSDQFNSSGSEIKQICKNSANENLNQLENSSFRALRSLSKNLSSEKETNTIVSLNSKEKISKKEKIVDSKFSSDSDDDDDDDIFDLHLEKNRRTNFKEDKEKRFLSNSKKDTTNKKKIEKSFNYSNFPSDSDDDDGDISNLHLEENRRTSFKEDKEEKFLSNSKKDASNKTKIEENFNASTLLSDSDDDDIFNLRQKTNHRLTSEKGNEKKFLLNSKKETSNKTKFEENFNDSTLLLDSDDEDIFNFSPRKNYIKTVDKSQESKNDFSGNSTRKKKL